MKVIFVSNSEEITQEDLRFNSSCIQLHDRDSPNRNIGGNRIVSGRDKGI